MEAILIQFMPWLVGGLFALLALVGIRAKSKGKTEARQEVATKTNQQAAEAAKVIRDVQREKNALPSGRANQRLRDDGWMRD